MSCLGWIGWRRWTPLWIGLAGLFALACLGLAVSEIWPSGGGWRVAARFFSAAFHPTAVPWGALLAGLWEMVRMAAAATGLALIFGSALGYLGSQASWEKRPSFWRRFVWLSARSLATFLRSIHELLWAVVFLAALGLKPLTAVLAIALPYMGTFAKVFAEMLEESPGDSSDALRHAGGSNLQVFAFGLLPRAVPDLLSYGLYRFECGLRSASVMGFLGIATPGLYIKLAADDTLYGEVWTWLYAMLLVIAGFDLWSSALRKRLTSP